MEDLVFVTAYFPSNPFSVADLADDFILRAMFQMSLEVRLQRRLEAEPLPAVQLRTGERLLPGVGPRVANQVRSLLEGLEANVTGIARG